MVTFFVLPGLVWFGFGFGFGVESTVLFYFETEPCCAVLLAYKELRLRLAHTLYILLYSTRTCSGLHIFKCDAVRNTGNVGKVVVFDIFIIECKTSWLLYFKQYSYEV